MGREEGGRRGWDVRDEGKVGVSEDKSGVFVMGG